MASSATDGKTFSNISATTAQFGLKGGIYVATIIATFGGGNVILQGLAADASTWLTGYSAAANAYQSPLYLCDGQYRFSITTATAVYASVASLPI